MWKLIITDDQGQHTVVNLVRDEYRIGRAEDNPIRLTERNISRHHAVLQREGSGFVIVDLDSDNGVFVNGVRIRQKQGLGHRDLLQLGDYRVEVVDETLDTQEQGHSPYPGGATIPPAERLPHRLVVLIGPNQGSEFALEGDRYLIGRDDDCDFRLDHGSVSRIHAEVRRLDAEHFEIIDKGSANGLRINGHERPRAVLDGRDVVELGDVVLKYIMKGEVFRVDAAEGERIAAMSGTTLPVPESEARLPLGVPLFAATLGAAVIAGALFFVLKKPEAPSGIVVSSEELRPAVRLQEAGDIFRAHEEISRLPMAPKLQSAPEFIAIETSWAQAMMRAADAESDPERRKELLVEVIKTPTIPQAQRNIAEQLLRDLMRVEEEQAALAAQPAAPDAEDITDLPVEEPLPPPPAEEPPPAPLAPKPTSTKQKAPTTKSTTVPVRR